MTESLEVPVVFRCQGEELVGIIHPAAASTARIGVLVVVGGPQYRVGSHRQFTLMARRLAAAGYAVMRFDHRGIGDSGGAAHAFEEIGDDIRAAIQTFLRQIPALERIVLWGLCDAASAILLAGIAGERLGGLILVNPWVRTAAGEAETYLKHYYGNRLLQKSFWRELFGGRINVVRSVREYLNAWRQSRSGRELHGHSFVERMRRGLAECRVPVLLLISGQDLVAAEFTDLCNGSAEWQRTIAQAKATRLTLDVADHTFSNREALDAATDACRTWLDGLCTGSLMLPRRTQA